MGAWKYQIYFSCNTRNKSGISALPCIILYILYTRLLLILPLNDVNLHFFTLMQTFALAYGSQVDMEDNENVTLLIQQMIECLSEVHPELLQKQKFHLLLHLQDEMLDFGPPAGFNTERYSVARC